MTREVTVSLSKAEGLHQRLHTEMSYLKAMLEKAPAGCAAEVDAMLQKRQKAADALLSRIVALTVVLPAEADPFKEP